MFQSNREQSYLSDIQRYKDTQRQILMQGTVQEADFWPFPFNWWVSNGLSILNKYCCVLMFCRTQETERLQQVLSHPQFKEDPIAAITNHLMATMPAAGPPPPAAVSGGGSSSKDPGALSRQKVAQREKRKRNKGNKKAREQSVYEEGLRERAVARDRERDRVFGDAMQE